MTKAEQLIEALVNGEDTPANLIEAVSTYIYHWKKDVANGIYNGIGLSEASYRSNMHYNREMAMKLAKAGYTAKEIAKLYPKIWSVTPKGRLKSIAPGGENTKLTMANVQKHLDAKK